MGPQFDNHYLQCLFSRQRRYLCHQNKDFHIRLNRLSYHYHHYLYHHYRISLARLVEVGHRHCNQHLHRLLHHHHHYLHHHHNLSPRHYPVEYRNQDLHRLLHHHHHYLHHHHNLSPRHYLDRIRRLITHASALPGCNQDLHRLLHHHHHHLLR